MTLDNYRASCTLTCSTRSHPDYSSMIFDRTITVESYTIGKTLDLMVDAAERLYHEAVVFTVENLGLDNFDKADWYNHCTFPTIHRSTVDEWGSGGGGKLYDEIDIVRSAAHMRHLEIKGFLSELKWLNRDLHTDRIFSLFGKSFDAYGSDDIDVLKKAGLTGVDIDEIIDKLGDDYSDIIYSWHAKKGPRTPTNRIRRARELNDYSSLDWYEKIKNLYMKKS